MRGVRPRFLGLISLGGAVTCGVPLPHAGDVVVEAAELRMAPVAASSIASYLTLYNRGTLPDTLLSVASTAAAEAGLHSTMVHDGLSMMMADSILVVEAKGRVEMRPGGVHLMLEEFRQPIALGDTVPIALHFSRGGVVALRLVVKLVGEE